jgi:LuxR family maltose regulon positive regulatory protein/two-component system response regulator NreC
LLELLSRGLTDKEIAAAMGIGYRTVRTHLERLYDRFGVTTRAGLIGTWLGKESKSRRDVPLLGKP